MKVVAGLGNPGTRYDDTRHNVGWWVLDRLAYDWGFGSFERSGAAVRTTGRVGGVETTLLKPVVYMNRSGAALVPFRDDEDFRIERDLLVVVDDATLDVGRVRFRPRGGAGGHNGLKSVIGVLGSEEFARLRIGVGIPPAGEDLAEWVLAPMPAEDEDIIVDLLPELTRAVEVWIDQGTEEAMNQYNR